MAKRGSFQGEIGRVQDPRHATESQRTGTENFGLQIADYRLKLGRCPYFSSYLWLVLHENELPGSLTSRNVLDLVFKNLPKSYSFSYGLTD